MIFRYNNILFQYYGMDCERCFIKSYVWPFWDQNNLQMSHDTTKRVFGSFWPGKTQTDLLSYRG